MNSLKNIGILLVLLFSLGACKEYLDVKPKGEVLPETADEFAALLHYRINKIDAGTDGIILGSSSEMLSWECCSDNLEAGLTKFPDGSVLTFYIGSKLNNFKQNYEYFYSTIRDCNLILQNLKERDSEAGKKILATAYALRGVCYYKLMQLFCEPYMKDKAQDQLGMPLVTYFDMEARPRRSDLKKTAELIESDLKTAIDYNQKDEIYRYTADVTRAYLAKFYLWTQNWEMAASTAKEVLDAYPLLEGQAYVKMLQAKNTKSGNILIRSFMFANDMSGDLNYTTANNSKKYRPVSKKFVDLFVEKGRDIRYSLSFNAKRETQKIPAARVRSAEMCLIMAESYAHMSDDKNALFYLNQIRSKRITDYTPYTMTNLPEVSEDALLVQDATGKSFSKLLWAIQCERQKELFMEGDRWFEMKRQGSPEYWIARDGLRYDIFKYMYTAPIPRVDMDLTPGMEQNKGYE